MQRDGIQVRIYSLAPGDTVPCAVFPHDDLVVAALRADFSGVDALTLLVTGSGDPPMREFHEVPLPGPTGDLLWAKPAAVVRQMPSMRLQLTLESAGASRAELGRYVLEHSAFGPMTWAPFALARHWCFPPAWRHQPTPGSARRIPGR